MYGESITFTLDEETRDLFHSDRIAFYEALQSEMEDTLKANAWFFHFDCDESREEVDEESISLNDIDVSDAGDGKTYYNVDGYVHWGCRDIDGRIDHDGQFFFEYDIESGEVTIPFRELPERDTNDI